MFESALYHNGLSSKFHRLHIYGMLLCLQARYSAEPKCVLLFVESIFYTRLTCHAAVLCKNSTTKSKYGFFFPHWSHRCRESSFFVLRKMLHVFLVDWYYYPSPMREAARTTFCQVKA